MKALLVLALAFSSSAFAKVATLSILPSAPIVILGDTMDKGTRIPGPWFQVRYMLSNESAEPITILALNMTITAPNGVVEQRTVTTPIVTVAPGATQMIDLVTTGNLPAPGGRSYVYSVSARALGWMGTYENPGQQLPEVSLTFQTQ